VAGEEQGKQSTGELCFIDRGDYDYCTKYVLLYPSSRCFYLLLLSRLYLLGFNDKVTYA